MNRPASGKRAEEHFAHPHRNVDSFGIEPGMKIADFGAGSGAYVSALAAALSGSGKIYAIDIQKDLLRRIKNESIERGHHSVEVIWADLEMPRASKIADGTLDLVLISNLLFQLHDKRAPLVEAKRILKKNGRLVIIDWAESFGGLGPIKTDVFDESDALALAHDAGFELVRRFPGGAHHYGLIFKVKSES